LKLEFVKKCSFNGFIVDFVVETDRS